MCRRERDIRKLADNSFSALLLETLTLTHTSVFLVSLCIYSKCVHFKFH